MQYGSQTWPVNKFYAMRLEINDIRMVDGCTMSDQKKLCYGIRE